MPRKKTVNRFFAWNQILDELQSVAYDQVGDPAGVEHITIDAFKDLVTVTVNRNDTRIVLNFTPDDPYPSA